MSDPSEVQSHQGAEVQSQQGAEVQSQQGADPRPVFQGDWATATGAEKGAHSERVRQWKARQPKSEPTHSPDARVAAILGSGAAKAVLDPVGLRVLREVALDKSAPASARATAANALRAHEEEESRVATDVERDRVTSALSTLPQQERLLLLERIVRRHEPAGWQSVFARDAEGADPAAPAAPAPAAAEG